MPTPTWKPGTLYAPGSLVIPSRTTYTKTPLTNPDFEAGNTGWTVNGGVWSIDSVGTPYHGAWDATCTGQGELINNAVCTVIPGHAVTAKCAVKSHGTTGTNMQVMIIWYDGSGTRLTGKEAKGNGNSQHDVQQISTVTATAPAGAATFRIAANGIIVGTGGSGTNYSVCDYFDYSYDLATVPDGLVYKATQAKTGRSAASEPAWPGNTTTPVTDNEVTWQGVIASRVVWEATPVCKSGGTEPAWPTVVGGVVSDGTMAWKAISRRIEDSNCPNSKVVAIMASKVFAADGDIIRFCATVNPLDWTTPQDAGYLPSGLQQANANDMAVLAPYRSNLAAFNASSFQNWQVDPDPQAMALLDQMDGVGSTFAKAAQPVGNELFYLARPGVRSVSVAAGSDNLRAGDVGMPVDELVREAVRVALANGAPILATYVPGLGQYWLAVRDKQPLALTGNAPDGTQADAYSYQYTLSGGVQPVTLAVTAGSLPAGLTLSPDGLLSGTPGAGGSYSWTLSLTDADGTVVTLADSCTVTSALIYNWTTVGGLSAQAMNAAFINGDTIVVGHQNGAVSYSYDRGTTFAVAAAPGGPNVMGLVNYAGNWWTFGYAGATGNLASKSVGNDLTTLASVSIPFRPSQSPNCAFVYGSKLYVGEVSSVNYTLRVYDGTTWTQIDTGVAMRNTSSAGGVVCFAYSNGAYLLGTSDGSLLRSTDMVTFASVFTTSLNTTGIVGLAAHAGKAILGTQDGLIYQSTDDGATWGSSYTAAGGTSGGRYVLGNKAMFIAAPTSGLVVYTSTDGTNGSWVTRLSAGALQERGIGYATSNLAVIPTYGSTVVVGSAT